MNQYVNHTKSDDINSDIRAISALQAQCDDLTGRLTATQQLLEEIKEKIQVSIDKWDDLDAKTVGRLEALEDKALIARENIRILLKAHSDIAKVMDEFKLFMGYTPSKDH